MNINRSRAALVEALVVCGWIADKWVQSADEPRAHAALRKTLSLRARYPDLTGILDQSFFGAVLTIQQDGERAEAMLDKP